MIRHVPDRCQGCGAELAGAVVVGVEARQVFELPPLRLLAREHRAERRRIAADLGMDQTDLQPRVAAAAAVNALRGAFIAWFLSGASGDPQPAFDQALDLLEHGLGSLSAAPSRHPRSSAAQAPSGNAGPDDEVVQPSTR